MFERLSPGKGDALLALMGAYRADTRPGKIDVGVGVYRDVHGHTPVMAAVKASETRLLAEQDSKAYLGLVGNAQFNDALTGLVLGDSASSLRSHVRTVQTPGGCGALRALLDLAALSRPDATVWLSDPTWANHLPLLGAARLRAQTYPYYDRSTHGVRFEAMLDALRLAGPSDVVLLHGCCHNPSGADLSPLQWDALADLALERGFVPLIDLAYQGLGDGLDQDSAGVRLMAARIPELLLAVSCSKNFGLYRDRVGCAMVFSDSSDRLSIALDRMLGLLRGNYSMPPDHGAAVVADILGNTELTAVWRTELDFMRARLRALRSALCVAFRGATGSDRYDFIARQSGMFSLLDLSGEQVAMLRQEHAIYMPADSRTNIAGLQLEQVGVFVQAVCTVSD